MTGEVILTDEDRRRIDAYRAETQRQQQELGRETLAKRSEEDRKNVALNRRYVSAVAILPIWCFLGAIFDPSTPKGPGARLGCELYIGPAAR